MRRTLPLLLGFGAACTGPEADPAPAPLVINEVMTSSAQGPDWVELYNPTDRRVALDRYTLADSGDRVAFHPGTEIGPRSTLILVADGTSQAGHVELKLDVDGETLELFDPMGHSVDAIAWGPLLPELSLARTPDGGADWQIRDAPTPGAPNGGEPFGTERVDNPCIPFPTSPLYGLENEPLVVEAACAEPGGFSLEWYGPARGSIRMEWTPGLHEAGVVEALLASKPANGASVPNTVRVQLSIADAWDHPNNIGPDPETYESEWGLPVLHVAIDPGTITQEDQPVTAWLDGEQYSATIKIRGSTSAGFPKNSFTMEFDPVQLDLRDHGLQNKDHLVLVSNFDDVSHVRQRLVYDTWAAMAGEQVRATPRSAPIVVYLNGAYHGLYLALDRVDDEFLREMGFVDGGDLFKSVDHNANFYLHDELGLPKASLGQGWEKKEGAVPTDFTAIEDLTAWAGSVDHATAAAELDLWVDPTEFSDWYHLVFALGADDSAGKNAYLYVDPTSGLYRYVPWDFNHSLGQMWTTERQDPAGLNNFVWNNAIFWHLQSDPTLADAHWARLQTHRQPGGPLALESLLDQLVTYDEQLGAHPERDWARWESEFRAYPLWSFRTDMNAPTRERLDLEQWLRDRDAVLAGLQFGEGG